MFTTNLLPAEEKSAIRREELRLLIRFFGFIGTGALMLGILFLLPTYLIVVFAEEEADRLLGFEEEVIKKLKIAETENRVGEVKTRLKSFQGFLAASSRSSRLLTGILEEAPGITLTNFTVKKDGIFILSARAATRKDLLEFEGRLRSSGFFQEFSFPLSNLIRETSINFTLQGTLAPLYRL